MYRGIGFLIPSDGKVPMPETFDRNAAQSRVSQESRLKSLLSLNQCTLAWTDGHKKVERIQEGGWRTQKSHFADFTILPEASPGATRHFVTENLNL